MIRRMDREGLVKHEPYYGVVLTDAGEREALRLLRRHRLWELFLTDVLGLSWDQVHEEAHRLEHATSVRVAEGLAKFLGEPEIDPHGQQIPERDGTLRHRASLALAEVGAEQLVQVVEVPDDDPVLLRRWARWGLVPGASIVVQAWSATGNELEVRIGSQDRILSRDIAGAIQVLLPLENREGIEKR
jgi:DtxR family Mn-dependent transcriptional regulator